MADDASQLLEVFDSEGGVVFSFEYFDGVQPTAEIEVTVAEPDVVVATALDRFPGWWVSTKDPEVAESLSGSTRLLRHAQVMERRISVDDEALVREFAANGQWVDVRGRLDELVTLTLAAYGPDHVDHAMVEPGAEAAELRKLLDGSAIGPVAEAASGGVEHDGRLAGACLVNRIGGADGLPWVTDVLRDPSLRHRGLGRRMLEHSIGALAAEGADRIGLAVTVGNPARAVYLELGFEILSTSWRFEIPGGPHQPLRTNR
jgi:ribosomal protein S18 acetylase RimI-like enzyme